MNAPLVCLFAVLFTCHVSAAAENTTDVDNSEHARRVKLFDSVFMNIPDDDKNVVSFQIDTQADEGSSGRGKKKKLMQKLMPLFVMPFILQSTIIPLFLGMIKFLLFKSLMVGKLALVLIILNSFRNHNSFKGRNNAEIANVHYGYQGNGMEEYASYFN